MTFPLCTFESNSAFLFCPLHFARKGKKERGRENRPKEPEDCQGLWYPTQYLEHKVCNQWLVNGELSRLEIMCFKYFHQHFGTLGCWPCGSQEWSLEYSTRTAPPPTPPPTLIFNFRELHSC